MDENNDFKNVKVFEEKGFGINIINHEIRCEFKINVSQYCIVDIIAQRKTKGKTTGILDISTFLGIDGNTIEKALNVLKERKLVVNKHGNYYLNKSLSNKINKIEDSSLEFEEFWTMKKGEKIVTAWPGPKKKAKELYDKAIRNRRTHKFIMDQRMWYFKILEMPNQAFRNKMIATRFLNINSGELDQDWKGNYEMLKEKNNEKVEEVSAITMDYIKNEFE